MLPIDAFAFIPLIAASVVTFGVFVFLIVMKLRKTAKPSFVLFLSLVCLMAGMIFSIFRPNLIYLSFMIFMAVLLSLPYCIMKGFSKPEEKGRKEKDYGPVKAGTRINVVYDDVERKLLEVNKDFLAHTTGAFSAPDGGMDQALEYFATQLIELIHADGSMILLMDDFDDIILVKKMLGHIAPPYLLPDNIPHKQQRVDMSMKYAQFPLKDNIFGDVVTSVSPALINEPLKDSRIVQNEDEDFLKCGSYIFVPLIVQEQVIGEIVMAKDFGSEPFTDSEFDIAKKLADFIAVSIHAITSHTEIMERVSVAKEGEIASRTQKSIIPSKIPALPGILTGSFFEPAENICGDFYDVVVSRKDRIAFILGDVTGKNMNSLVVMLMIRAMIRLTINTTQTAGTILSWANRGITSESTTDHFASISLLLYDSVSKKIQYSSAGTNPIFKYTAADGTVTKISDDFEPVGVEKNTEYKDNEISVEKDDIIITCTDGLVEALNNDGVQYSSANLEKIIKQCHTLDGKTIANRIKDDVKDFCGSAVQHDDQSLLVIKIQ